MESLPHDVLAVVLRLLPPRTLAISRSVCKPWRDIVDGPNLLVTHHLPLSVHGIFVNYILLPPLSAD
uniref:F-box domain-containing protein n=1 Tax=Leersia perrieri TaxID=77586 RepID=A0A0D9XR09_9ORYZ